MQKELKSVHLIGAGGIGLSAVGKLLLTQGVKVRGTDVVDSEIIQELAAVGAEIVIGHKTKNLLPKTDLVIYSSAVPENNPERLAAVKQGVKQQSYFEFLGELSQQYATIAVSGTHGKSTTTALLGLMLEAAGFDPMVIVGAKVPGWSMGNFRLGQGEYLIIEGCEHMAHMLELRPQMIVLTNLEAEHLDFFRDLDHLRETFQKFVDCLPADGWLIRNVADPETMKLRSKKNVLTYAIDQVAGFVAMDRTTANGRQTFEISQGAKELGKIDLRIPGEFNVANALAATATAMKLGVKFSAIKKVLSEFPGVWRRFERVGQINGALVISDYAHHPTAIRKTLLAAREFFPRKRLLVCFQPHQHARTRDLFSDFVSAFDLADELILVEIYDVVGRHDQSEDISSRDLLYAIEARDRMRKIKREVIFVADPDAAEETVRQRFRSDDVVMIIGAGDIDRVARNLCK